MKRRDSSFQFPKNIERYLAALSKLYAADGEQKKQAIIVNSQVRVHEESSYDNLDGGTYGHAVYLVLPEELYLATVKRKGELQKQLKDDLNKVHDLQHEFVDDVFFEMEIKEDQDWRRESGALRSEVQPVSDAAERRIWTKGSFRLFLSHKAEEKKRAAELKASLKTFGVSCFLAHEDIKTSREWQREIESALFSMDALAALMTKNFHDSLWTDQEVGVAIGRSVPTISLRLGTDPYGLVGKYQALSCSWEAAPLELVKVLIPHDRMLNAYIKAVGNCSSFEEGNRLADVLPSIEKISEQQVDSLLEAFNENVEARGSFGFNGTSPVRYGGGLVQHLARLTGTKYRLLATGRIAAAR